MLQDHPDRHPRWTIIVDPPCSKCLDAILMNAPSVHITTDEYEDPRSGRWVGEYWCQNRAQYHERTAWIAAYLRANHPDPEGDHYDAAC